jgi:hypothetical protein
MRGGGVCCVSYSYSYSIWHGKAVQPTREPEAHGVPGTKPRQGVRQAQLQLKTLGGKWCGCLAPPTTLQAMKGDGDMFVGLKLCSHGVLGVYKPPMCPLLHLCVDISTAMRFLARPVRSVVCRSTMSDMQPQAAPCTWWSAEHKNGCGVGGGGGYRPQQARTTQQAQQCQLPPMHIQKQTCVLT